MEGLINVEVIADDILIYGSGDTEEEALRSHDQAFISLLERAQQCSLKLNTRKLKFKMDAVRYMGHIISSDGIKPDPSKVTAVADMPHPTDVTGVQ